jgi:hypothetical protein
LITGESGTGKELVAQAIHENSNRKNQPFITISCAGLPETLIESELFGYRKGSFTGAILDKIGFVETANKGTLFLDEIGELTPNLQVKLLRLLQEKKYIPIGETKERSVDVRFIMATNKDPLAGQLFFGEVFQTWGKTNSQDILLCPQNPFGVSFPWKCEGIGEHYRTVGGHGAFDYYFASKFGPRSVQRPGLFRENRFSCYPSPRGS